jgi:hypothetical protein
MKRNTLIAMTLSLCGVAAWLAYPVYAHCGKCAADGKKIVEKMQTGKVTLAKAIEAAETHSKGKAVSVTTMMDTGGNVVMQVFSIVGDKIQRCDVNGQTGVVGKSEEVDHFPIAKHDDHAHDDNGKDKPGTAKPGGAPGGIAMNIVNREAELACAGCVYKMSGAEGCQLAVKVDGKNYMLKGNHGLDAHEYCGGAKKAVVTGKIEGDTLTATEVKVKS